MTTVDLNCDVGEGVNNEAQLMPYISSCNVACGAHAGDVETIDNTLKIALTHRVNIGAHPSFPDRKNFGRKALDISSAELSVSLIDQIKLMQKRILLLGGRLNHIKAHGALYNVSAVDQNTAAVVVSAVKATAPDAILYVPYHSVIERVALAHQLTVKREAFADRNYQDDLTLVARTQENAVITDKDEAVNHILEMIAYQRVKTVNDTLLPIQAETFCVHGDNKKAIELVKHIHRSLLEKGISIA